MDRMVIPARDWVHKPQSPLPTLPKKKKKNRKEIIKKRKTSFLCEFSETLKWAAQTGVSILEDVWNCIWQGPEQPKVTPPWLEEGVGLPKVLSRINHKSPHEVFNAKPTSSGDHQNLILLKSTPQLPDNVWYSKITKHYNIHGGHSSPLEQTLSQACW